MSWGIITLVLVVAGVWIWLLTNIDFEEELEEIQRELEEEHSSSNNGS